MATPLRWGILSAGKISHDFVLSLKTLPQSEHHVVAIAARNAESAEKFACTHSIPQSYSSYDQLGNDPNIDVVYVGNIDLKHYDVTLELLDAGKPVLCEKPMTVKWQDTKALIDKSREKGLFLMEAMWMRFFPAIVELKKLIAEGFIGDVNFIKVKFLFLYPMSDPFGGGSVLDAISLTTMLFGGQRPEKIDAHGTLMSSDPNNYAVVTLWYSGDRKAEFTSSVVFDKSFTAVISGTKGELRLPHPFWCPTKLEIPQGTREEPLLKEYPLPEPCMPGSYTNCTGLRYEAQEVYHCLKEGKKESRVMSLEQSLIIAEVADDVMNKLGVEFVVSS